MELQLDDLTLAPIVESALGRRVTLGAWRSVPFSYQVTNPLSAGIWRISGTARDGDAEIPWSVILKIALSDYDVLLKRFPAELRLQRRACPEFAEGHRRYGSTLAS